MKQLKKTEMQKWLVYNGSLLPVIEEQIRREFTKPETVIELLHRVTPINLMRKIILKLATCYSETPVRNASNEDVDDSELLEKYEDVLLVNMRMQEANRHMELFKKICAEIYVTQDGIPGLRILPPHTYYTFSSSSITPEVPDNVWKIIKADQDPAKCVYSVWTDSQFIMVDGTGALLTERMISLNNTSGINTYGVMPFVYMTKATSSTEPVPDDDLFRCSIVVPVLLTDLLFSCKFQSFGIIYTVGMSGELPSSPNSIIHLNRDAAGNAPEINVLKPTVDVAGVLQAVESIVSYLLSTRGLKTTEILGQLGVDNAASGISKAIDNSDIAEDKKEQQSYFYQFERKLWHLLSQKIVPVWRQQNLLTPDLNAEFSPDFSVALQLQEPKVTVTALEQVQLSKAKIDNGFSTTRRELYTMYPDFNDDEIEKLLLEIEKEKQSSKNYNLGLLPSDEEMNGLEPEV